jgi:hypothetical protein
MDRKIFNLVVLLDLKKAFDTVNHEKGKTLIYDVNKYWRQLMNTLQLGQELEKINALENKKKTNKII